MGVKLKETTSKVSNGFHTYMENSNLAMSVNIHSNLTNDKKEPIFEEFWPEDWDSEEEGEDFLEEVRFYDA